MTLLACQRKLTYKGSTLKAVFSDGTWIEGYRPGSISAWILGREPKLVYESEGTHHLIVIDASEDLGHLIGKRVAVPICGQTKYWEVNIR